MDFVIANTKNYMAQITFYTKPNCKNAIQQIELLELAGHEVIVVDLLAYSWTKEKLLYYFNGKTPAYWYNPKAPSIKSGELNPTDYNTEETIELLLEDHILIRRPIIDIGTSYQIGFDKDKLDEWIGLKPVNFADSDKFLADVTSCHQNKIFGSTDNC